MNDLGKRGKKYYIICFFTIILTLPIFFGQYIENFYAQIINTSTIFVYFLGIIVLFIIGGLIDVFGFNVKELELIKDHDVIQALIKKENRLFILIMFILTMIMEELIFRYYIISFLSSTLSLNLIFIILISSVFFSLYHIHIWFKFQDLRILGIFMTNSFLLGLFLGFIFLTLGFSLCLITHSVVALIFYLNLYNKYFRTN
ncbi:MAG: CPBP family intramembrane glutamic endopeptidase [Candidatus Thorarchaeota archaeon]